MSGRNALKIALAVVLCRSLGSDDGIGQRKRIQDLLLIYFQQAVAHLHRESFAVVYLQFGQHIVPFLDDFSPLV